MLAITKPLATRHPLLSLVLLLVCMLLFGFVVVVYASFTHNLIVLPTTQRLHSMSICVNVVTVHHVMLQVVCLQPKGTPSANYTDTHTTAELSRASFNKILLATSSFNNSPSAVVSWLCRWSTHCRIIFLLLNCLQSQQCIRKPRCLLSETMWHCADVYSVPYISIDLYICSNVCMLPLVRWIQQTFVCVCVRLWARVGARQPGR